MSTSKEVLVAYPFPDQVLKNDRHTPYRFLIWVPEAVFVVLGRGNNAAESVYLEMVRSHGVKVVQRPTGGEAVLLTPHMLVISLVRNGNGPLRSATYFQAYTGAIIDALRKLDVAETALKGISDITIGDKKIAGTSLYRNAGQVFFHGVLNVSEDPRLLERYLRFPARSPAYRRQRTHSEFVTSLQAEGYDLSPLELQNALAESFAEDPLQILL
jgi:lipoate-protein ligase A